MDLQALIRPSLWRAIQSTYETRNYSQAILAAIHYLSDVLRDRTGLDGDGYELITRAMGSNPLLRLNKLQTETEKNQQEGVKFILMGIYKAIRNPRSHEQLEDDKKTADAIIGFIDYLVGLIEQSEEPFTVDKFLITVFDNDFVPSEDYARLLIAEVPNKKLYDTLVSLYRGKTSGDIYNVGRVVKGLIDRLSDKQLEQFILVVGDELRIASDEESIRYNLHLLPPNLWPKLPEIPRLRIENRIVGDLKEGRLYSDGTLFGALATWAPQHFVHFSMADALRRALLGKLNGRDELEVRYVLTYFLKWLPEFGPVAPKKRVGEFRMRAFIRALRENIVAGNEEARSLLLMNIYAFPNDVQDAFVEEFADLTDVNHPAAYLHDRRPFLTGGPDDIPF